MIRSQGSLYSAPLSLHTVRAAAGSAQHFHDRSSDSQQESTVLVQQLICIAISLCQRLRFGEKKLKMKNKA